MKNMIDQTQLIIFWNLDDLKLMHIDARVVENNIKILYDKFGTYGECNANGVKTFDYLDILLDYRVDIEVFISIEFYINDMLISILGGVMGIIATPVV